MRQRTPRDTGARAAVLRRRTRASRRARAALPRRARASLLAACVALGVLFAPAPAGATPETLKRSLGNALFAPLDIAASPVTAGVALYTNLRDVDDARWKRIVLPLPGYLWILGAQIGGAAIREIAGLLELLPGLALAGSDADLDPLFAPAERNEALVDVDTRPLRVKFGVNYVSSATQ